jgi:hypothetical protein
MTRQSRRLRTSHRGRRRREPAVRVLFDMRLTWRVQCFTVARRFRIRFTAPQDLASMSRPMHPSDVHQCSRSDRLGHYGEDYHRAVQ